MIGVAAESDLGCVREDNQDAWNMDEQLGLIVVSDAVMTKILGSAHEDSSVCAELIDRARRQGAPDNVTALIWDFEA